MEGDKKRSSGWSVIVGVVLVSVALALGGYVWAYYATVNVGEAEVMWYEPPQRVTTTQYYYMPFWDNDFWEPFFWPINQIDRRVRPHVWYPDREAIHSYPLDLPSEMRTGGQVAPPAVETSLEDCVRDVTESLPELPNVYAECYQTPGRPPAGLIIHIRNLHYLPLELFAADVLEQSDEDIPIEEIERLYREFLDAVEAVQEQQVAVLEWLWKLGCDGIWVEGMTDESRRLYKKYAADYALWSKFRTTRLELGAPGKMFAEGKMRILPLDDKGAMDAAEPDATTTEFTEEANARREEAMVCRIVSSGRPVHVVILGGGHNLKGALERLQCNDWWVLNVDVKAYRKAAGLEVPRPAIPAPSQASVPAP